MHWWCPVQAAQVVDRLQQPGQQAQLMGQPVAEGQGGPVGDAGPHQREAQMQLRLKNKLINELRDHKRQLAGGLMHRPHATCHLQFPCYS